MNTALELSFVPLELTKINQQDKLVKKKSPGKEDRQAVSRDAVVAALPSTGTDPPDKLFNKTGGAICAHHTVRAVQSVGQAVHLQLLVFKSQLYYQSDLGLFSISSFPP